MRVGVEVFVVVLVLSVGYQVLVVGLGWTTRRAVIPPSCRQPSSVDYSKLGPPSYGPYSVKFTSSRNGPWGESSRAVVGHGQSVEDRIDYGVILGLESTDIDRFECRWSDTGVTLVEPTPAGTTSGIEHFVPAKRFLGGR